MNKDNMKSVKMQIRTTPRIMEYIKNNKLSQTKIFDKAIESVMNEKQIGKNKCKECLELYEYNKKWYKYYKEWYKYYKECYEDFKKESEYYKKKCRCKK